MDALDYTTQFINDTDRKIKKKRKRKGKNKKAGGYFESDAKKEKKDDKGDDNGDDIGDKGSKDGLDGKLELLVASIGWTARDVPSNVELDLRALNENRLKENIFTHDAVHTQKQYREMQFVLENESDIERGCAHKKNICVYLRYRYII